MMKMRTFAVLSLLLELGCRYEDECMQDDVHCPALALALPAEVDTQLEATRDDGGGADCSGVVGLDAGDPFVVVHRLSPRVGDLPYALTITVTTPCTTQEVEAEHFNGVVVRPMTAPPGAHDGFVVTAEIANSRLRCEVGPQAREPGDANLDECPGADATGEGD